ncbi:hypothetical protein [Lysinibacillus fusiformis]|uniref:hypothetical protein n=1 Tax=Lysinibacillus fusiformis TaxID=28031 RepID=UPI003D07F8E2
MTMIAINQAARQRIIDCFKVDLHDWLASPELPDHDHAVACMKLAELVVELLVSGAAGRGTPDAYRLSAYSIALDIAMEHFVEDKECSQCGEDLTDLAHHCEETGECVSLCECEDHAEG